MVDTAMATQGNMGSQVAAGPEPPPTGRRLAIQDWTAVLTILLAFGTLIGGSYFSLRSEIVAIHNEIITERGEVALVAQRVSTLESKAAGYDRVIEQRNIQYAEITAKLARIEEFMEQIKSGRYR